MARETAKYRRHWKEGLRDGDVEREGECYRAEKTDKNRDLHKLTTSDMKEEKRE